MAASLDVERLSLVFQSRPDILAKIQGEADTPSRITLFNEIANFVYQQTGGGDEPASKRRRIDVAPSNGHTATQIPNGRPARPAGTINAINHADAAAAEPVLLQIKDISVSVPQRKKYDLCFTENFLYARASGSAVPVQGIVYSWKDIEHAFYLPVPDKSQVQYNYVLFPRNSGLPSKTPNPEALEPLVFTVGIGPPKPDTVQGTAAVQAAAVSDTYSSLFHWALGRSLRSSGNPVQLVASDPKLFASAARQPYRPNEKAVHVKAFRGSKDGFLFFLPTGILWGFKKPLLFLPLDRIVAVSYTNVLQRTFNIVVELDLAGQGDEGAEAEIEFAMVDQEDYQAIDETYVKRHGLQDRSMAERRKAKRELVENARDGRKRGGNDEGDDAANGHEGDGLTELERARLEAEQQLQDEEDEEEEDYDPGSDGESEGEGSSSDEDDDDDDDGPGEGDDDEDEGEED